MVGHLSHISALRLSRRDLDSCVYALALNWCAFGPGRSRAIMCPMNSKPTDNQYSDKETAERLERGLKNLAAMPHIPHKPKARPARKGRVHKAKSRS
jgi:hypothetical protein